LGAFVASSCTTAQTRSAVASMSTSSFSLGTLRLSAEYQ
jgi:hypothetical protein